MSASSIGPDLIKGLPIPTGAAIAIGCIGLFALGGTRFGGVAAAFGGVAVIFQLSGWIASVTAATGTVA